MISEIGELSLIMIYLIDILIIINISSILFKAKSSFIKISYISNLFKFIFSTISFVSLIMCFYYFDLSILAVAKYSSSNQPLIYKIVGSWANHEGSMILWLFEFNIVNILFLYFSNMDKYLKSKILSVQSIIELFIIWFTLNYSNPFVKIIAPSEGSGLNPLLQDIGLAIHPPLLYFGYVFLSIPFSFTIIILLNGSFSRNLFILIKPWVNIGWIFLTSGITVGSWWAYRELGWGGFWFWDPVENLSLMPWLISTALIHTNIAAIRRNLLIKWFFFMSISGFCLSIFGSFLVRSGILISVHSFANDYQTGKYLLFMLLFITVIAFSILIANIQKFQKDHRILLFSKESSIVMNNLLLLISCLIIFLSIIFPILYQLQGKTISVGEGYFITILIPIFIITCFVMVITNRYRWNYNSIISIELVYKMILSSIISLYLINKSDNFCYKYFIFLSIGLLLVIDMSISLIKKLLSKNNEQSTSMIIAHLFVGIIISSITINNYNKKEDSLYMIDGQTIDFMKYDIELKEITYEKKDNFYSRKAKFLIKKSEKELAYIYPEFRIYTIEDTTTYESDIYHSIDGDLYVTIGEMNNDKLSVKIYYRPMMNYIWVSSFILILSAAINLFKYRNHIKIVNLC